MNTINILWLSFILPLFTYILNEIKEQLYRKIYKIIVVKKNTTEYKWLKSYLNKNAIGVDKLILSSDNTISDKYLKNEKSNYAIPFGKYYITYNNIIFTIYFTDEDIKVSTYSINNSWSHLTDFIKKTQEEWKDNFIEAISIYTQSKTTYNLDFNLVKLVFPRNMDTIILPKETKKLIFDNLDSFFKRRDIYKKMGITYKRGILFEGLPGTGKTSILKSLCRKYDLRNIYIADLNNDCVFDKIEKIQGKSMIIIEDIDRYFQPLKDNDRIVSWEPRFDLSKMLNMLDGALSPEECLIVITTNNKNIIPSVMLRPGRIDLEVSFTYCTREQIIEYTQLFYDSFNKNSKIIKNIANKLSNKKITIAQLQKYYLEYIENIESALDNIDTFIKNITHD